MEMDDRVLHSFAFFFFLCFLLSSDSSLAERPPPEAIQQSQKLAHEESSAIFSPSIAATQLDNIPVVNPTTPTTTTPTTTPASPSPPTTTTTTPPTPTTTTPTSTGGAWCVANPTASETALQVALDYACSYGGTDCSAIQPGASCYNPNTVRDHASYAFNDYYQKNPIPTSCVFGGASQLTNTDPSSGNCHYATPRTSTTPTTPAMAINSPPPPLSTATPVNPYTPTVPYYAGEPTATPSAAYSPSDNLLPLLSVAYISLIAANYL